MDTCGLDHVSQAIARSGFLHVRNFLTHEEVEGLRAAHMRGGGTSAIRPLGRPRVAASLNAKLRRLHELCLPDVDLLTVGGFFFEVAADPAARSVNFPWHVDHESWYLYGQHRRYLNVWLPVAKDRLESANLCVVPHERLRDAAPEVARLVEGHGAIRFADRRFTFDARPCSVEWNGSLDDIAETPHLGVGDALVLRGDVLHRTQDRAANRTALSFRSVDAGHVIQAAHYYPHSIPHVRGLLSEVRPYATNAFLLDKLQVDSLPLRELMVAAGRVRDLEGPGSVRTQFERFLSQYQAGLSARLRAERGGPNVD